MTVYTPFLKLKQNELQALAEVDADIIRTVTPLFDVPRTTRNPTENDVIERLRLGLKELDKTRLKHKNMRFFLDNYDLDDTVLLNGVLQYEYILNAFQSHAPIPVVALNRVPGHNQAAINFAYKTGKRVGLRLQQGDLDSFALAEPALDKLMKEAHRKVDHVDVLIDFRHIKGDGDTVTPAKAFLAKYIAKYPASSFACSGSIIPANISELIKTNSKIEVVRAEIASWEALRTTPGLENLVFGDYGVVSPDYSDADIGPQLLRQVSTPKAFYPFDRSFLVVRGSSFESHPKGNDQFFDLADDIATHRSYRTPAYSTGDAYVHERSSLSLKKPAKAGSPGSWTKAMTAAHVTFVSRRLRGLP